MAQIIDFDLCIFCQCKTKEALRKPTENPVTDDHGKSYVSIFNLVHNYKEKVGSLPHPNFVLPDVATLRRNNAAWHKSCRNKYTSYFINRKQSDQQQRKRTSTDQSSRSAKTPKLTVPINIACLFCEQLDGPLHSFTDVDQTPHYRNVAETLGDNRVVTILSPPNDLLNIQAKYHLKCRQQYLRRYNSVHKSQQKPCEIVAETLESEMFQSIQEEIANGCNFFSLQDLTENLEKRYQENNINSKINRTMLKERILLRFPDLQEEIGARKKVFLICSKAARKIICSATQHPNEEIRTLLQAASILRKATKEHDLFRFTGSFPNSCEEESVPFMLKYFFSQLLLGPKQGKKTPEQNFNSREVLTLSQLSMQNINSLHTYFRYESPLSIYLSLKLHADTRSKRLVELLHKFSIGLSYKKVLAIENGFACAIANSARENDNTVCPSNLRTGLFTVAAIDNLDHNPSSNTASSSFHGTGISMYQFASDKMAGKAQNPLKIKIQTTARKNKESLLPSTYTFVPPVSRNLCTQPPLIPISSTGEDQVPIDCTEIEIENTWASEVKNSLEKSDCLTKNMKATWSAFHANRNDSTKATNPCIEALLPLFRNKAATPEMIKHGMEIVQKNTRFLNPVQIPVIAMDQPLYELAKKLQWTFPDNLGEDRFVVLLGGLHIEMALWCTLGDVLRGSGWTECLKDAGIAISENASLALLKTGHLMKTRYAHQVTFVVMTLLLQRTYEDSGTDVPIEVWLKEESSKRPTFHIWHLVLEYQKYVFAFIRAHRESKIKLMVYALKKLVPLFLRWTTTIMHVGSLFSSEIWKIFQMKYIPNSQKATGLFKDQLEDIHAYPLTTPMNNSTKESRVLVEP